jgi:hypothetical protein
MKNLLTLLALFASCGLTLAQEHLTIGELCAEESACAPARCWASTEYLGWWLKNVPVPPLVTAGGDGVLGSPGTRVLVDQLEFMDSYRGGVRVTAGCRLDDTSSASIEGGFFYLADGQAEVGFASPGTPVLARPFIDAVTGQPAVTRIASPGNALGTVSVAALTELAGAEANLTANLADANGFQLKALAGFRYLSLEDELTISELFYTFGNRVGLVDDFRTSNRFFGAQVGVEADVQRGPIALGLRGKVGLGQMRQFVQIGGITHRVAPDGALTDFQGGLLALRSNIGRYRQSELAVVPELGLNVNWRATPKLRFTAGYTLLWASAVVRAGAQIDPVVNQTQFPLVSANGPLQGPARPAFRFAESDFWAQGLSVGFEFKY